MKRNSGLLLLLLVVLVVVPLVVYGIPRMTAGTGADGFQGRLSPADTDAPYTQSMPNVYVPGEMSASNYGSKLMACRSPSPAMGSSCPEGTFCDSVSTACVGVSVRGASDPAGYYA